MPTGISNIETKTLYINVEGRLRSTKIAVLDYKYRVYSDHEVFCAFLLYAYSCHISNCSILNDFFSIMKHFSNLIEYRVGYFSNPK